MSTPRGKYNKISDSVRNIIVNLYFHDHAKVKYISEVVKLSESTINKIVQRYKKHGDKRLPRGHRQSKLNDEQKNEMKKWVDEDCQLTLDDIASRILDKFGIVVAKSTIHNYFDDVHYSVKRVSPIPIARNCPSTVTSRTNYARKFMEIDPDSVIFVDEAGVSLHCRSNYGRSKIGTRANLKVRAIRGRNYSICAAISKKELVFYQVQEKAYNTEDFVDYLKQLLAFLHGNEKKHTIVMDNVRFHHAAEVEQVVQEKGHELLYLPPYSPFLNPIENMFNQLKFYIKRVSPANADEVFAAVENASHCISQEDCQNYWMNMMKYVVRSLVGEPILN